MSVADVARRWNAASGENLTPQRVGQIINDAEKKIGQALLKAGFREGSH